MLKRVSVELWFVRSTKNVGAILVIALYSVIALLLMRQFMNCLYGAEIKRGEHKVRPYIVIYNL